MKELLTELKEDLTGVFPGLRKSDIFFTVSPDIIPGGVRFPCIGIRAGEEIEHDAMGGADEKELEVEIYYYDKLVPGDSCILNFIEKGDTIKVKLDSNTVAGYEVSPKPRKKTPIFMMYKEKELLLRRGLFYQYEREG